MTQLYMFTDSTLNPVESLDNLSSLGYIYKGHIGPVLSLTSLLLDMLRFNRVLKTMYRHKVFICLVKCYKL